MIRAKFTVQSKIENQDGTASIILHAVYTGSEENKQFFAATPSGSISLNIINPEAARQFEQGKEYYVDFTPAN